MTCTLGEVKNRADFLIYWGGNPAECHPRHFTKYTLTQKGKFVPNGHIQCVAKAEHLARVIEANPERYEISPSELAELSAASSPAAPNSSLTSGWGNSAFAVRTASTMLIDESQSKRMSRRLK